MNGKWILAIIGIGAAAALAQTDSSTAPRPSGGSPSYQPAIPAPTSYYYGGGDNSYSHGASTAAGSALAGAGAALSGMGQALSGAGQRNLANSAAAINYTQARSAQLQNYAQQSNTFWEVRAQNRAGKRAERLELYGPPPTTEQIARWNRSRSPKPLSPSELNPVTGQLTWPAFLREPAFDAARAEVDQIVAKVATYGGLNYSEQAKARQTLDAMSEQLKTHIKELPPSDYVACSSFLDSVGYVLAKGQLQ